MSAQILEPATHGPNVNGHTHTIHVPQRAAAKEQYLEMSLGAEFQLESSSVSEKGVVWAVDWATMWEPRSWALVRRWAREKGKSSAYLRKDGESKVCKNFNVKFNLQFEPCSQ